MINWGAALGGKGAKPVAPVAPSGGGINWGQALAKPYVGTAPAKPPLSASDQKVLKSFQTLDVNTRTDTLKRLQLSAKSGNADAARKLTYLLPAYKQNIPKETDYTDKSLAGTAFRASQFLQSQVPGILGQGTAGDVVSRDKTGKVTNVQGGHAETQTDVALRGIQARLNLGGPKVAAGTKAPMAILKSLGLGAGFGSTSMGLEGVKSYNTQGKTASQIAANTAKHASEGAVIGSVFGGGSKIGEVLGSKLSRALDKSSPDKLIQSLNTRIAKNGLLRGVGVSGKTTDTFDRNIQAPTTVDPTTRTLRVNPKVLQEDLDHLAAGKGIELPSGQTLRAGKGKTVSQAQDEYLDHLVSFEESHIKNASIGDVMDMRAGKQIGQQMDMKAMEDATGNIQALKENPNRLAETVSEAKTTLSSQSGHIGGKGETTPAIQELRSKVISGVPKGERIDVAKGKLQQLAQQADTQLRDKYSPVQALSKAYEKQTGTKLTAENDPYGLARLSAGSSEKAQQRIQDLGDILRESPDVQAAKDVGIAQRILTDRSGMKNPISQDTAKQVIEDYKQKLGPEAFKKTQETVDKVIQFHDLMLKELRDNGIISKEAYDAIKAKNQNYFGKFDVVDHLLENSGNLRKGSSFNVAKQDLIKSQRGTEKAISDPIEASIRQIAKGTDLIERNKVGQALYRLSDEAPELVKKLEGDSVPAGSEKISTFIDGKKVDLAVPKDVGEALKHLNAHQADLVTKTASLTGNILRKTATSLNTGFALISNPIRDVQSFALNSKNVKGNPYSLAKAWLEGLTEALKQGDAYREFISAGGGQSTFFNPSSVVKTSKQLTRTPAQALGHTVINPKQLFGLIPAIERAGQTIELAPRLAEFKAARRAGKSAAQSALDARNVTVDFSQSGTVGQVLNQWVPFLNARLQGNLKGVEAIARNPVRAGIIVTSNIAIPAIAAYTWNRQHFSDVYDQIPQYIKDSNFVVIYGNHKDASGNFDQVVKIPKGDFAKVFGNSLEEFLNFAYKKDPKSLGQIGLEALSNLSPVDFTRDGKFDWKQGLGNALPPLLKGGFENASNYSFFKGGPLVPTKLQGLPNNQQVAPNTSAIAKALGGVTGQSPIKVDNLLQSFTANTARSVQSPQDFRKSITGRVTGAGSNNAENRFYDVLDKTTPLKNDASKRINSALAGKNHDEAHRIADEYNRKLEQNFADNKKNYGKYWTQDMKDLYEKQKIKLSPRSIKSRETRMKKK